jgi:MFS family permease
MYQIGGVCALFFVGPATDTCGRKWGMQIGAWIIIIGAVINGTTALNGSLAQLKVGRFVLGFGVSIISAAGPIYVVETAHPAFRGIITAYCNCLWFTGSILASWAIRGTITMQGNASWTIPVYLQMLFPGLIVVFAWFIPESPRWLYVNHKRDKAVAVLTKYHGYGNRESAWVRLQLEEYEAYLNMSVDPALHCYKHHTDTFTGRVPTSAGGTTARSSTPAQADTASQPTSSSPSLPSGLAMA